MLGALFSDGPRRIDPTRPVSPLWVALAARRTGRSGAEVVEYLQTCGYAVDAGEATEALTTRQAEALENLLGTGDSDAVEAAEVLRAVRRVRLDVVEVLSVLDRWGVTVRHREALDQGTAVAALLLGDKQERDERRALTAGDRISYRELLCRAGEAGCAVAVAIEQLRHYGVEMAIPDGDTPTRDDLVLLSRDIDGTYPWLREDSRIGLVELVLRARKVDLSLTETADRLRQLGIPVAEPAELVRAALARVPWAPQEEVSS